MRRYDIISTPAYGSFYTEMAERDDGDYVEHADHVAEVRQTQRRMIAALYWRAGEREIDLLSSIAAGCSSHFEARLRGVAENAYTTARRVEVTCAH